MTTLYQFGGLPTDGLAPSAARGEGTDPDLYGTTELGGTNGSNGTVFQITPAGMFTTLYQFGSLPTDGLNPAAPLLQGSDGDFYGTTASGGTNTVDGTLFKITLVGTSTTLYQFGGVANDGLGPFAGLVQPTNGLFYGQPRAAGRIMMAPCSSSIRAACMPLPRPTRRPSWRGRFRQCRCDCHQWLRLDRSQPKWFYRDHRRQPRLGQRHVQFLRRHQHQHP